VLFSTLTQTHRFFSRPEDPEELFNLRHASARNAVERIFGVVKRRFRLMTAAPEYSFKMQAKFVPALAALHNFIQVHEPLDIPKSSQRSQSSTPQPDDPSEEQPRTITPDELGFEITTAEKERAAKRRDDIAKEMWFDYQVELRRRGIVRPQRTS
jgi:hypothetical protein